VADAWKIGQQQKDNGVLLIVSKQERRIRIEVGRGLEGKLTDLMAGRIIDQVIKPRFQQGDFDGGFAAAVSSLITATRGEFKAEERPFKREGREFPPVMTFLLIFGFIILFLGVVSRVLGGIAGAIGLPTLVHLSVSPLGIVMIILLALVGFGAGFFLSGLFSSGISRRGGRPRSRDDSGGFFHIPGMGGHFPGGGGFGGGGGFSGGGGSFGGGGASGGW
jgi:uncharacterized protein